MTNRTKEMRKGVDLLTFDGSKRGDERGGDLRLGWGEGAIFEAQPGVRCIYRNAPSLVGLGSNFYPGLVRVELI